MEALTITQIALAALMWLMGLASHYLKKCIREKIGFKEYWTSHPNESVLSVVGGIAALIVLLNAGETDLFVFFGAGYIADSLINKAEAAHARQP